MGKMGLLETMTERFVECVLAHKDPPGVKPP